MVLGRLHATLPFFSAAGSLLDSANSCCQVHDILPPQIGVALFALGINEPHHDRQTRDASFSSSPLCSAASNWSCISGVSSRRSEAVVLNCTRIPLAWGKVSSLHPSNSTPDFKQSRKNPVICMQVWLQVPLDLRTHPRTFLWATDCPSRPVLPPAFWTSSESFFQRSIRPRLLLPPSKETEKDFPENPHDLQACWPGSWLPSHGSGSKQPAAAYAMQRDKESQ